MLFLFAALCGFSEAASVALVFFWRPRYSEQSWRAKALEQNAFGHALMGHAPRAATQVRDMVLCTLAMAFGWCIIHAVRWTNTDLSKACSCLMHSNSPHDIVSICHKVI